jgi:hypothetical protein
VAVSPEEIGLCGCRQIIAVMRESLDLTQPQAKPTVEIGYYATSVWAQEYGEAELGEIISGHWSAIEKGTHYRRDATLGDDACRTADRQGAEVLASLRNLANDLYELEWAWGRTKVDTLKSWCQRQTLSRAWALLRR